MSRRDESVPTAHPSTTGSVYIKREKNAIHNPMCKQKTLTVPPDPATMTEEKLMKLLRTALPGSGEGGETCFPPCKHVFPFLFSGTNHSRDYRRRSRSVTIPQNCCRMRHRDCPLFGDPRGVHEPLPNTPHTRSLRYAQYH